MAVCVHGFYRPDFTIRHAGEDTYWEHLGRLDDEDNAKLLEDKASVVQEAF
jgi:hypothetical protein